jgi:arsenate reductase
LAEEHVVLYHNAGCSKSRRALELLHARGIQPRIVEYLETPLDEAEIVELLRRLGLHARDLLRPGEPIYRELGLDAVTDEATLVRAIAAHPVLMERPVAVCRRRAVIGRPPERIFDIL